MNRLLCLLALMVLLPVSALAQPSMLALYKNRGDASHRLHNVIDNIAVGGALVDCCNTVSGTLTYDPASREILLVQQIAAGQELVRISAASGAVTGRAVIAGTWQIQAAAYDRTRATLFALGRDGAGNRHLLSVARLTGVVTPIGGPLPASVAFVLGGHGLHPRRGQWHLLGADITAPAVQRVVSVSLTSGAVLANAAVSGYTLSNLAFDEGSGRLLGNGRAHGSTQTSVLWLDPGNGQVTGLVASGIPACCPWGVGGLAAIASDGVAASQFTASDGVPRFLTWGTGDGVLIGVIPQVSAWALHGLVVDQSVFTGDYLFADGFQTVGKPTGSGLPFE